MELIIAEKPSVAKDIAKMLGVNGRKDGYLENHRYLITWCIGHFIELCPPNDYDIKYESWNLEDLPIIPTDWKYRVAADKKKQYEVVKSLMLRNGLTNIICATDAAREGELIFWWTYEQAGCNKSVQRLWVSDMNEKALKEAFANIKPSSHYNLIREAAVCRAHADYLVGYNGTRLFSILYRSKLNIGRVMTPTLNILVARFRQIENFVKQLYYHNHIDCGGIDAVGERIDDHLKAQAIREETHGKDATVTSVEAVKKTNNPPKLYDLTTLQREANRIYGLTASETLKLAQSLYEKKYITYPRSDSQFITTNMEDIVMDLVPRLREKITFITDKTSGVFPKNIIDNSKVSDHHALIPTRESIDMDLGLLTDAQKAIYNMIAVRLISATDRPHIYNETIVNFDCAGYLFTAKEKVIVEQGWKNIDIDFRKTLRSSIKQEEKPVVLSQINQWDVYKNVNASISDHTTTPPKHHTDDTLLAAMETAGNEHITENMEKKGIGTTATRDATIDKLIKLGFAERVKKNIIATKSGIDLIDCVPEILKSPKMTADWEQELLKIEQGRQTKEVFMTNIVNMVNHLISDHKTPIEGMNFVTEKEEIGKCPRCQSPVFKGKNNYYCSNKECKFVLWENTKFFAEKKKKLTKKMVQDFLLKGQTKVTGLYSLKKDTKYDAVIVMKEVPKADGSGDVWINFEHDFSQQTKKKSSGRKGAGARK